MYFLISNMSEPYKLLSKWALSSGQNLRYILLYVICSKLPKIQIFEQVILCFQLRCNPTWNCQVDLYQKPISTILNVYFWTVFSGYRLRIFENFSCPCEWLCKINLVMINLSVTQFWSQTIQNDVQKTQN